MVPLGWGYLPDVPKDGESVDLFEDHPSIHPIREVGTIAAGT